MKEAHDVALPQFQVATTITVFVAVGNVLAKPLMMTAHSTNTEDFKKFLKLIL